MCDILLQIIEMHARYCKQPGISWRKQPVSHEQLTNITFEKYIALEESGISTVDGAKCTWREMTLDYMLCRWQIGYTMGSICRCGHYWNARRFASAFKKIARDYHTTTGFAFLKSFHLGSSSGIRARPMTRKCWPFW